MTFVPDSKLENLRHIFQEAERHLSIPPPSTEELEDEARSYKALRYPRLHSLNLITHTGTMSRHLPQRVRIGRKIPTMVLLTDGLTRSTGGGVLKLFQSCLRHIASQRNCGRSFSTMLRIPGLDFHYVASVKVSTDIYQ